MSDTRLNSAIEPPLPAAAAPALDGDGELVPVLTFWRKSWVQNLLPFVTSVVIHLGLIILIFATYRAASQFLKVVQEQIIIPDATLMNDVGGIPNPGLGNDRNNAAQAVDSTVTESSGFANTKSNLTDTLVNTPSNELSGDVGAALGAGSRGQSGGVSNGIPGALAQFGNPGGGQVGPHGRVFGHGGNAVKIVYICDASGSMMTKIDVLNLELQKSVQQLQPVQAFDVIFFHDVINDPSSHYIAYAPDLVMATANNKMKLYTFLKDVVPSYDTHVIPALTMAFHLPNRPDLIYLLTDGAFEGEGSPAVIDAIAKLNVGKKVKVNTILFLGTGIGGAIDDAELKEASTAMRRIASENGGVYNQVSVSDLGN
jgi:hypothetical protein